MSPALFAAPDRRGDSRTARQADQTPAAVRRHRHGSAVPTPHHSQLQVQQASLRQERLVAQARPVPILREDAMARPATDTGMIDCDDDCDTIMPLQEQDADSKLFYCSLLLNDVLYVNEFG